MVTFYIYIYYNLQVQLHNGYLRFNNIHVKVISVYNIDRGKIAI